MFIRKKKSEDSQIVLWLKRTKFYKEHGDVIDALREITSWNDFAASLVKQV